MITNFTNEEIILENEIKRKDTRKIIYIEPQPKIRDTLNLLGSTLVKLEEEE